MYWVNMASYCDFAVEAKSTMITAGNIGLRCLIVFFMALLVLEYDITGYCFRTAAFHIKYEVIGALWQLVLAKGA